MHFVYAARLSERENRHPLNLNIDKYIDVDIKKYKKKISLIYNINTILTTFEIQSLIQNVYIVAC